MRTKKYIRDRFPYIATIKKVVITVQDNYFSLSTISKSALGEEASKYLMTSRCPCRAAQCRAVWPWASMDRREKPEAWRSLSWNQWQSNLFLFFSKSIGLNTFFRSPSLAALTILLDDFSNNGLNNKMYYTTIIIFILVQEINSK